MQAVLGLLLLLLCWARQGLQEGPSLAVLRLAAHAVLNLRRHGPLLQEQPWQAAAGRHAVAAAAVGSAKHCCRQALRPRSWAAVLKAACLLQLRTPAGAAARQLPRMQAAEVSRPLRHSLAAEAAAETPAPCCYCC